MICIIDRLLVGLDDKVGALSDKLDRHIRETNYAKDKETIRATKMTESLQTMVKKVKEIEGALNPELIECVKWPIATEEALADLEKRIGEDNLYKTKLVIYSNFPQSCINITSC